MSEINQRVVCNGVDFQSIQSTNFKTMRISVHFMLPIDKNHISANAVLPALLCRASKEYPDYTKLSQRLSELYGASLNAEVQKLGDTQLLSISTVGLADQFTLNGESVSKELAELLCSIIFDPPFENGTFRQEDFNQEIRQTVELIDSEFNDKRIYAKHRCEEIMCSKEPYGIPRFGSKDAVRALQPNDLKEAWSYLIAHARIRIMALGNCNPDLVFQGFQTAFEKVDRSQVVTCSSDIITDVTEVKDISESMEVAQSKLVMGFRTQIAAPQKEIVAARLMTAMFGGTPHSKLFLNVREKMSLCYYCAARYNSNKGIMTVESGVETQNIEAAKNEILNQLEEMKRGNFTEEELQSAKLSICNSYRTIGDYLGSTESWYISQIFMPDTQTPEQAAEEISKVTREEIIAAAQKVTLDTIYRLVGTEEE